MQHIAGEFQAIYQILVIRSECVGQILRFEVPLLVDIRYNLALL